MFYRFLPLALIYDLLIIFLIIFYFTLLIIFVLFPVDPGYLNVLTEDHEFVIILSGDVLSRS